MIIEISIEYDTKTGTVKYEGAPDLVAALGIIELVKALIIKDKMRDAKESNIVIPQIGPM